MGALDGGFLCRMFILKFVCGVRGDIKIPLLKLVTFCRKTSNVCWWSFVDQLHPHHMLGPKVTWVTTASYTILGNVFLLNGGSSHQPSAKA